MHDKTAEQALKELKSAASGLSQQEAGERLKQYGLNEIREGKRISPFEIFIDQFKSIVIWILIVATVISAFLKEYIDAIVILIIVILISVLGFVLEYRAERAIEALKRLASLKATVIRDGQRKEIDSREIVIGDVIFLETGDKVPADARLLEAFNLQTQEAALTGESQPVKKHTEALPEKIQVADMKNMAFSGTIVVSGRGKAVVAATGMQTEIGKIATMIEDVKPEPTPLQKKMDELGKWIGKVVIAIAVIIFAVASFFQEKPLLENLIVAVAVAVAAIPEALLAIVTMALAIGTQRMLKRNALVRRLPSVETLGSTTVICSDKTGTLTANEMTVRKLFVNGKVIEVTGTGYETKGQFLFKGKPVKIDEIKLLLRVGALNNNAELKGSSVIGDPTEGCLIVSAAKAGLKKEDLETEFPRTDEIEFTSERKMMTTIHNHHGEKLAYAKGAPEVILRLCSYISMNGDVKKLTDGMKKEILEANKEFAGDALRVLGFAYKTIITDKEPEKNLIFAGLQGMIDPPREEVKLAIEKCNKAGIKVVMVTGDHEVTAKAVAREIGLSGKVVTGQMLDEIKNLEDWVEDIAIYARVNPEHKIKIIDALRKKGHVVAMTGDGVNDAPALKKADIGIAMGITGTDVAKEASAMILTDDNFASIVNAVEEGRGVYDNIRKYIGFLLSGNISEVLIIFLGIVFGLPLPLTATQILLINLVTDGLPALALSADPYEPNAMARKPRKLDEPIFKGLNPFLVYYPIVMTITSLLVFGWFYFGKDNLFMAQTAVFLTISMFELYQAFASRSTIYPAVKVGLFRNKYLILAALSSFVVIAASIFIPSFGRLVDMSRLGVAEFIFIVAISSIGAIIIELCKHYKTRNEAVEVNI
ncbi:calcium-translocating P-type ATPase, PMCA-type [Candidatus Woesearchaeota archaeon]|nr:calcium-translocating P-type ATPase, PMCA-type [Candidatus Woesearchaeota archaeon]